MFNKILSEAITRERWTAGDLAKYQVDNLRRLLVHAGKYVPYYTELFGQVGFEPERADLPEGLSGLPLQSKATILEAKDRLISSRKSLIRFYGSTSGTTGTPIEIQQNLEAINRENAFIARQLRWAGYKSGDPRVWIRGDLIVPAESNRAPYWRHNLADNMLMMSSYHLSRKTANEYIDAIAKFRPRIIQTYPSSITLLAKYLEDCNQYYNAGSLSSIVTSSETLEADDKEIIERRFCCKVFDWYGSFERVAAIGTCEKGTYHLISDYSYVEFESVDQGLKEVIGTGFNNYRMPLVRYKTGDLVEIEDMPQACACGRQFPVVRRIIGRSNDCIKLSNGKRIARLGFVFHGVSGIAEGQIIQDQLDEIRIRIVPFGPLTEAAKQRLIKNARQRLGKEVDIQVEVATAIERTSHGKVRLVVCNV